MCPGHSPHTYFALIHGLAFIPWSSVYGFVVWNYKKYDKKFAYGRTSKDCAPILSENIQPYSDTTDPPTNTVHCVWIRYNYSSKLCFRTMRKLLPFKLKNFLTQCTMATLWHYLVQERANFIMATMRPH